ncbi:uncharacterized protein COLE_02983 [Cutaneotrichosporon oleaginosum]|nr:hypothetical protein COLE_02983 [Cutaneotrichosporon oleaginosum]
MLKATIGLGVLAIPYSFQTVGLIPGIILLTFVIVIVTWSDVVVGTFKQNHPDVYSIPDIGRVLFGRAGEWFFTAAYVIYMIFSVSGGMVAVSTALNAVTVHAACTAIFVVVSAVIAVMFASIQTLGRIQFLGWFGIISILAGIMIVTVAVGIQDRPAEAPQVGPWDKDLKLFASPTFAQAMSTVAGFVYATCNPPTFIGFVSEMRDFRQYKKSMYCCQIFVWAFYITIGTVMYFYCGQYVAFPALGSAGVVVKRVAYGIALPGLLVTLIIYTHLPAKFIFVKLLRGSRHLNTNTPTHWVVWLACTLSTTVIAYIMGSAIPIFSSFVGLVGATFAPFMCMIPMGFMWLKDNYWASGAQRTTRVKLQAAWAALVTLMGIFLVVGGTYAAILDIRASTSKVKPWSCTDNSNSVPTA